MSGFNDAFAPNAYRLTSPLREVYYALALRLDGKADTGRVVSQDDHVAIVSLLNRIGFLYAMPWAGSDPGDVAWALTFIDYVNSGVKATVEQVIQRTTSIFEEFDRELLGQMGLDAKQATEMTMWIATAVQDRLDRGPGGGAIPTEKPRDQADFSEMMRRILGVTLDDLAARFGPDAADAFWCAFVSRRSPSARTRYYTQQNPIESSPLIEIKPGLALVVSANQIFNAVTSTCWESIRRTDAVDRAYRRRDKYAEDKADELCRRLANGKAKVYRGPSESPSGAYEHDLVVTWEASVAIIEVKASRIREPLRDPDRALPRIRDDFRSESGIEGGMRQAKRVIDRLDSGKPVRMYERTSGAEVAVLDPSELKYRYACVLTFEHFGPLESSMELLLDPDLAPLRPWAMNLYDFETLIGGFESRGWGVAKFFRYLQERKTVAGGRIFIDEEIEMGGWFLRYGTLQEVMDIAERGDRATVLPGASFVFDELYLARKQGRNPRRGHDIPTSEFLVTERDRPQIEQALGEFERFLRSGDT
ncbi:MAG: hypothetical protein DK306_002255 [Chloroflexi bacterium]|nr:MAG: hypothetical protein DK306_002255 [Chloroflexota bacterium]